MITRFYCTYLLSPTAYLYISHAPDRDRNYDHTLYLYTFILRLALGGLRLYTHFDDNSDGTEAWHERLF